MDQTFLIKEPVLKLMRKYSVPCVISLLVGALYNIVDQIFIANASYLGSYGNAANTIVFPLTIIALAIAVMIGDGACAYVSIKMGEGHIKEARYTIGHAIVSTVVSSIVLTLIYLVFADGIVTFFGARVNEMTYQLSREYFFYITLGIPFYMFGQSLNPIIRSDGSPRFAMVTTLLGALINIILDPIFIFVFKWGMMGAAVATVLGQVFTAVLAIYYIYKMKLEKENYQYRFSHLKRYIPLGMTSFLSQISLVASMAAINNMVRYYGGLDPIFSQVEYAQIPMAVVGIVMKVFQIVISISVGLAAGCIPVVGYNMGAKKYDRAKQLFKYLLLFEGLLGFIATLIVMIFPEFLIGIFGSANESIYYTQFAIKSFRTYLCFMTLATINKGTFIYLQALGKAKESTILSMLREVVFGVGFALLLPQFFGLNGVLYSMPVSDFLTFILAIYFITNTFKLLDQYMTVEREEVLA